MFPVARAPRPLPTAPTLAALQTQLDAFTHTHNTTRPHRALDNHTPTHAGASVRLLIHDLQITVIKAETGEILRDLTLDPTRDYQPRGPKPGPPKGSPQRGGDGSAADGNHFVGQVERDRQFGVAPR